MKIFVGLGNPGSEYQKTRHNIGFMAVDKLQEAWQFSQWKETKKFQAEVSEGELGGEKILLVKPLTFMNLSGQSIAAILNFYKEKNTSLVAVYDDIDLALGVVRIRTSGSPGTHNGMKSIVEHVGQDFARVRLGIEGRSPEQKLNQDLADYVLGRFGKSEQATLDEVMAKIPDIFETLCKDGIAKAMERFNGG